jgi:transketolase
MPYPGPMIIRIARGAEPNVYYDTNYDFKIGQAIITKEGNDLTFIGTGSSVYWSLMAAKKLDKKGITARVVDMHTFKPLDTEMVLRCAKETGCVITVEEHSKNGGLGGAVAEVLLENRFSGKFKRIGLPDEFAKLGDPMEIYKYYKMDSDSIAQTAELLLR